MNKLHNPLFLKKSLSPLLYVLITSFQVVVFVLLSSVFINTPEWLDLNVHQGQIFNNIASVIIIFISYCIIPVLGSYVLKRFEKIDKPRIIDHLRQTSLLYLLMIALIVMIHTVEVATEDQGVGLGFLFFFSMFSLVCGIIMNGLFLLISRIRLHFQV